MGPDPLTRHGSCYSAGAGTPANVNGRAETYVGPSHFSASPASTHNTMLHATQGKSSTTKPADGILAHRRHQANRAAHDADVLKLESELNRIVADQASRNTATATAYLLAKNIGTPDAPLLVFLSLKEQDGAQQLVMGGMHTRILFTASEVKQLYPLIHLMPGYTGFVSVKALSH